MKQEKRKIENAKNKARSKKTEWDWYQEQKKNGEKLGNPPHKPVSNDTMFSGSFTHALKRGKKKYSKRKTASPYSPEAQIKANEKIAEKLKAGKKIPDSQRGTLIWPSKKNGMFVGSVQEKLIKDNKYLKHR
jgi:hypothetical protein